MRRRTLAFGLATALCLRGTFAEAAGIRSIEVPSTDTAPALTATVWSPCAVAPGPSKLGRLTVPGVPDCAMVGDKLPLIVVSHGRGGWSGGHHDTAEALADAGFVVAALNHPGDTVGDTGRVDDPAIWLERPAAVTRLIDYMLGAWPEAARLDRRRTGFFGFSRGAFTGLALIGGHVNFADVAARCADGNSRGLCPRLRADGIPPERPTHDPRIAAAVLADPPTFLFGPQDLRGVTVPVQLWSSEQGGAGVLPEAVAALKERLPSAPDYRLVPNSAHFVFLAPCSPAQAAAVPQFCTDPPGFDRAAFHRELNAEMLAFFRQRLPEGKP